ncbi:MAG: SLC26A/SulP transporter family protein [Anaerolineales bacterium]|uniref:SulP family inorganic anion transporter n=1 Tax=Candidatus Villigracilis vicinus TaxID=3140679 RepID=UPI0031368AA9|nr:SLC26A/SulP transporter family protein [Anaerolineales bacterium]
MDQAVSDRLRNEFQPQRLLPALMMGTVTGILEVIYALSIASLIFNGDLAAFLPYGFGISLVSSVVLLIGTALTSSVPGVFSSTQDSSTVVMAVIAASLVSLLVTAGDTEKLATVLVTISLTTILTGLLFLTLGTFGLGKLVRYIPYPVMGGFLAGTGWLLVQGSFGVMTDFSLNPARIPFLLQPDQLIFWLPGVCFALALFFALKRFDHFLTMPAILLGSIALFYLAFFLTGTSIQDATTRGLLLGKVGGDAIWQPFAIGSKLLEANWMAILGQSGNIAIVLVLSVIGFLLNASALELTTRQDIQLNHELRSVGVANIVSGLLGGLVGYHMVGDTALNFRVGARGKLPGIVTGIVCAGIFLLGSSLLAYLPRPLLGGLLFFLGLEFLVEWVVTGWKKLSRSDYFVTLLILIVIAATNFLVGVGVGLAAAIVLFVVNYSRINVVRHALSGADVTSNVERCTYHQRVLKDKLGQQIYILELQGFLFFGTANALLDQMRVRLDDSTQPKIRFLIFDFHRVSGFDSSAVISFVKCRQITETQGITLVLTNLSAQMQKRFELDNLSESQNGIRIFPDLDHGLEWCEEQLLDIEQVTTLHTPVTLSAQLADSGFERSNTKRLLNYLERVTFKEGETLIKQGDEADRLYFIEMGIVSVYLELGDQKRVRLRTLGLGTAIGETGLYFGTTSTASAIAELPVTAYRLTRAALAEMKQKEPELAASFHEFSARLLSERLISITRTLETVLK